MKDLLQKKGLYVLIYVGLAVFLEMMTFISMKLGVAPKYFLLDLSIILMLATVIFVIPSFTAEAIVIVLFLLVQFILSFLNYTLNNMNGSVFMLEMMGLANEAAGAFTSEFMDWGFFFLLIAVPVVAIILLVLLRKYRVPYNGAHNLIFIMVFTLACMGLGSSAVYNVTVKNLYDPKDTSDPLYLLTSDKYLYNTFVLKDSAFKKFGTFAFYYVSVDKILSAKLQGTVFGTGTAALPAEELTALNGYFSAQEMSGQSAYSGILKGQNLITVMVESGERYAIDEKLTPTLHALFAQGYENQKYYARDKTNHSEAIAILGSYPVETPFTSNYSSNETLLANNLAFTLPSVLKADGYTTTYLHSNWGSYYGRESTHTVYGFENFYALEDMEMESSHDTGKDFYEFELDSDLFGKNLNKIAPTDGKPFYTFVTSLITHGHYDDLVDNGDYTANLSEAEKKKRAASYKVHGLEPYYEQITKELFLEKFAEELKVNGLTAPGKEELLHTVYLRYKRYQAGMMDLDRGIALLLQHLKDNGLLENTTLLFYGDHNAYYSGQNYYLKGLPKDHYEISESYNVMFGIYSGKSPLTVPATGFTHAGDETFPLTRAKNTQRCTTSFDIVPSTLDLFGYTFNRGLYMGSSMFSDTPDITFISRESGMLSDKYFSSDGIEILYGDIEDAAGVTEFQTGIINYLIKQQQYERMYKYDYFAHANDYEYADITKLVYQR